MCFFAADLDGRSRPLRLDHLAEPAGERREKHASGLEGLGLRGGGHLVKLGEFVVRMDLVMTILQKAAHQFGMLLNEHDDVWIV